jgi:glutamate racemase
MDLSRYQTVVMDWGIGGLSVYREIKRFDPRRKIVYFSDSGATPYGKMKPAELKARVAQVGEHFVQQGIRELVIACNAGSTVAPRLRAHYESCGVRIIDMISSGIKLVESSSFRHVGVIGGRRTILSRIYQKALTTPLRKIIGRIAQPLSALIERGELDTRLMQETLKPILAPLHGCDAVLLACTHYPAIQKQIQLLLPRCEILDPAKITARESLKLDTRYRQAGAPDLFLTTGNPVQSRRSSYLAFGAKVQRFIRIAL